MMWTTRPRSDLPGGISAVRKGRGDPVILIHGVGLTADSWGGQIDALAERFAVTAVDLPGHGASARLDPAAGIRDWVDAIASAVADIAPPYRIAGHSLGALLALHFAVRYPERCGRVAALNAIYRRAPEAARSVQARAASLSGTGRPDPTPTLERWFGSDLGGAPAQACRTWLETVDPAAYADAYRLFAHADSPEDAALSGLPCPALFLTGGAEPNSTPDMSRMLADRVPRGRSVIVPDAAHMAMMTHPAAVNAALLEFFTGETMVGGHGD